jgi:pyruvate/2-oxoglutarate/acetoin dehydrogenase E1 component
MPKMTMVEAINLALREEMARDECVIILGEDVGMPAVSSVSRMDWSGSSALSG